jgi:hypothetical protein
VTLEKLLDENGILVCCGSGGVGKTTIAASLAIHAAALGRRVLVLTIDPARRLANALGIGDLGNEMRRVPARKFEAAGMPLRGELYAMMLDTKRTFDDIVERFAPNADVRDAILPLPRSTPSTSSRPRTGSRTSSAGSGCTCSRNPISPPAGSGSRSSGGAPQASSRSSRR